MSLTIILIVLAVALTVRLITARTMRSSLLLGLGFYLALTFLYTAALPLAKIDGGTTSAFAGELVATFSPLRTKIIAIAYILLFSIVWIWKLKRLSAQTHPEELLWNKQLIWAVSLIAILFFGVFGTLTFTARHATGFLGEFSKLLVGFFSSPLFMEIGFFTCGFMLVYTFNTIRRIKEGDEFIEMEIPQHILDELEASESTTEESSSAEAGKSSKSLDSH